MGKKRLPPPVSPDDPVILAIKQAQKQPQKLSKKETRDFLRRRSVGLVGQGSGARVLVRRGKLVWRKAHGAGADLDRPPLAVEMDRAQQRYEAELNKAERVARVVGMQLQASAKGVKAHQRNAANKNDVIKFAHTEQQAGNRSWATSTAKQFNISPTRVRQICTGRTRK